MKITLLEPIGISAELLSSYKEELTAEGHEFISYDTKTTDVDEMIARVGDSDIVMIANNPFPEAVVKAAPNLKYLNVAFTGVDHVALDACKEKGILVTNAAGYSTQCVAEEALGLAISVLRFLPVCDRTVRTGGTSAGLVGREIGGKTVGIVGTGAIGTKTAELFKAFGAEVIAYSRTEREEVKAMGVTYDTLENVMAKSDIVSVHVPNNASTKGMISAELIGLMKPTAILINTARGAIVDNAALAAALDEGRISGAGIDVFDMEPPIPADYPLAMAKNTVLAPHVAFLTKESMIRRAAIVFGNVQSYLKGEPKDVVC